MDPSPGLPEPGPAAKAGLTASEYTVPRIGRLESRGEWIAREIQALRDDVKAIYRQPASMKGAAWAIGILMPLAVIPASWFPSSRFEAAVQAIHVAGKSGVLRRRMAKDQLATLWNLFAYLTISRILFVAF